MSDLSVCLEVLADDTFNFLNAPRDQNTPVPEGVALLGEPASLDLAKQVFSAHSGFASRGFAIYCNGEPHGVDRLVPINIDQMVTCWSNSKNGPVRCYDDLERIYSGEDKVPRLVYFVKPTN